MGMKGLLLFGTSFLALVLIDGYQLASWHTINYQKIGERDKLANLQRRTLPGKMRCSLNANDNDSVSDSFSARHIDKRGVTGRFSVFAEGLDAQEMNAAEFRNALKEKMMDRRRNSPGNKASQDYMYG